MEHFITKSEILINGLSAHLKYIDQKATALRLLNPQSRNYEGFYKEVSFFVHCILKNDDLKRLFLELINYQTKLDKNATYVKLVSDINSNVRLIGTMLLNLPELQQLEDQNTDYEAPFLPVTFLKIRPLLNLFETYDLNFSRDNDLLSKTYRRVEQVRDCFSRLGKIDLGEINDKIDLLHFQINNYEYFRTFEHSYFGVASAERVSTIYSSINPNLVYGGNTFRNPQNGLIQKGQGAFGNDTVDILASDAHKIFHFLRTQLNTQLSIELYVERFITYISLYYTSDFTPYLAENELQSKFEEFIFNAGYYPISEAQLKNGRLDTIAVDQQNAFLFEFKQVDLGKTDENNVLGKFKGAQVQSSIYVDSLKPFPRLNNHVFILLFTNRKVFFANNVDRIVKNGVTFIAKGISIYDKTASLAKQDCEIDINDLIN